MTPLKCLLRFIIPLLIVIAILLIILLDNNDNEPMALVNAIPRPPLGAGQKFTTFSWNLPRDYGRVLDLAPIGRTPPIVPQFRPMSGPPRNYTFNQVI